MWHIASLKVSSSLILPTPFETVKTLISLIKTREFYTICANSVLRIFAGAAAGVVLGGIFSLLSFFTPIVRYLLSPVLTAVKATPIASFIILFLILIGKEPVPSTTAALIAFPIIYANIFKGLGAVDKDLKEVLTVYDVPVKKRLTALYIPSLEPYFVSGIKSCLGLAWKAGIAAEVLCTPELSIGLKIHETRVYLETPTLFAWTGTVIILSLIFEKIIISLMGRGEKNEH